MDDQDEAATNKKRIYQQNFEDQVVFIKEKEGVF